MMKLCKVAIVIIAVAASMMVPVFAAEQARLDIYLVDASSRPIPDGIVALTVARSSSVGRQEKAALVVHCDDAGHCTDDISPGTYAISVKTSFADVAIDQPVTLAAGTLRRMIIRVSNGGASVVTSLGTIHVTPTGTLSTSSAPSAVLSAQSIAERGQLSVAQSLAAQSGITLNRPNGGAPGLPVSIITRGEDPKETIVQVDGQPINNSNTGDFDVSLLDPSAFSNVQILYGLAPASLIGANTEGGTINFHTLEPTSTLQGLLRYTLGSFVTNGYTFVTTGSAEKLGFAFDLHSYNQQGTIDNYPVRNSQTGELQTLGSGITGSNLLAKLRYSLGSNGLIQATVLTFGGNNDLSAPLSTPLNPNEAQPGAQFTSYAGSERSSVSTFYNVDLQLPLGAVNEEGSPSSFITARHLSSNARQTVTGPANGLSEYLLDSADLINDNSVEYERLLPNADLAIVARASDESLTVPAQFGDLSPTQIQRSNYFLVRYLWKGGSHLEYTAAVYQSYFSTFGSSFDPRAGVVWTPSSRTVVRASIGTGFQAPLLTEKIVPSPLPPPDANGLINIGNPFLTADHTTEYELDGEQFLGTSAQAARAEVDLYHTTERGDDLQFVPSGASPANPKLSYPVNVATTIAQGLVVQLKKPVGSHTTLEASYNINAAYPLALPQTLLGEQGNIVPMQQSQNVPLHRATLSLTEQGAQLSGQIGAAYESSNNDLNQPPFALLNASIKYAWRHSAIVVAADNLTNVYAGPFTLAGAGVPYPGLTGYIPTDAYQLQPASLVVTLTQSW